jgi:hypothetical protein
MEWELLAFVAVWFLVIEFTPERMRRAIPGRFTVRYLLLATAALALFLDIMVTLARR